MNAASARVRVGLIGEELASVNLGDLCYQYARLKAFCIGSVAEIPSDDKGLRKVIFRRGRPFPALSQIPADTVSYLVRGFRNSAWNLALNLHVLMSMCLRKIHHFQHFSVLPLSNPIRHLVPRNVRLVEQAHSHLDFASKTKCICRVFIRFISLPYIFRCTALPRR
jgi:hypothetical protein